MFVTIATFINEGPGRFDRYIPGDRLHDGPVLHFDVPASGRTVDQIVGIALDFAWSVGNRMASDAAMHGWPSTTRSLSVGDVLEVMAGTAHRFYAVASFGFDPISVSDFRWSIGPVATENERDR